MKDFYNKINELLLESRAERSTSNIILSEAATEDRSVKTIVPELAKHLGSLVRVGGSRRVYNITDEDDGYFYISNDGKYSFVLSWKKNNRDAGVVQIYAWDRFIMGDAPNYILDIPSDVPFSDISKDVADWIKNPKTGVVSEITEGSLNEMAKRVSPDEFIEIVKQSGKDYSNITITDLDAIARANDILIPTVIRTSPTYKSGPYTYNFSDGSEAPTSDTDKLAGSLNATIEDKPDNDDPEFKDLLTLASAKKVKNMSSKLYLMGKKKNGAFFRIEGLEDLMNMIGRAIENRLSTNQSGENNMKAQYAELEEKVKLVGGGKSTFIKSLLLTGAPSSGKTFVVMKTIKGLGLSEGNDYVVKKGRITTPALYRTMLERIDGLIIFDDCDSVVADKNAINMLKGALDTDPIREISYDVKGTMNTATLTPENRERIVNAMSRILRNVPEDGDFAMFEHLLKKKKDTDSEDEDNYSLDSFDDDDDDDGETKVNASDLYEYQQAILRNMPNKIDFKGRIIFISNMMQEEWDSAILTRSFTMNLSFTSGEMLDYIEEIKGHIKTPSITDEQKQEVIDFLRELYVSGQLTKQVNFRLFQQACDIRLADGWKRMISRSM